jgi:hypothetical protein
MQAGGEKGTFYFSVAIPLISIQFLRCPLKKQNAHLLPLKDPARNPNWK